MVACSSKEDNLVMLDGKAEGFSTFEELDEASPIIVRGVKTEESNTTIIRSDYDPELIQLGYTQSEFKITEVIKNTENDSEVKVDNSIPILEHSFYDKKTDKEYSYNGYMKMSEDAEYLLFLLPKQDNIYAIQGVHFGKVPLETDSIEMYQEDSPDIFKEIYKDARNKYVK